MENRENLDALSALLDQHGIPVLVKQSAEDDSLQVFMAASNFGVEVYVPAKNLPEALEIYEQHPEFAPDAQAEPAEDEQPTDPV